jgi:murein DD-endopeptidase MepM/ murein hydrolase activator NlpD
MLLRGTLAAAVVLCFALLSAHLLSPTMGTLDDVDPDNFSSFMLAAAPFSLGNPAAAAALTIHPPATPQEPSLSAGDPFRYRHPVRAKSGDTLTGLLVEAGVDRRDAVAAADALRQVFDPRRIRPGHEVSLMFERAVGDDNPGDFLGFTMAPDFAREVEVARTGDGSFTATETEKALTRGPARAAGIMDNGLFVDGERAGVPVPVLLEMIRAFSWDVDFQRDILPGDTFEVMWQRTFDETGQPVHDGVVLYAKLTLSGKPTTIYRFETANGETGYFDHKGQGARKALLRTPIDGAKLSSRFGKRTHPILGYTKMHQGVDFAAPPGTPIYAAGDGRIEMAGRNGAYGNYIRIRHTNDYSTAYAHLSRFASVARVGQRVRQGQIIGYVGTTGRSTGPHLHYEILRGGAHTNPLSVKMPSGERLSGKQLERFQAVRADVDQTFAKLGTSQEIATID